MLLTATFVVSLFIGHAVALYPGGRSRGNSPTLPPIEAEFDGPVISKTGETLPPYNTTYYFDQLIDHNDSSKGTFKQRYWTTAEHYEPGGPIVIGTPGEGNADGEFSSLRTVSLSLTRSPKAIIRT